VPRFYRLGGNNPAEKTIIGRGGSCSAANQSWNTKGAAGCILPLLAQPSSCYGKTPRSLYTVSRRDRATMYAAVRQSVSNSVAASRTRAYAPTIFLRSL
jgi:hypothetical protein